jgi:hypothetical protein
MRGALHASTATFVQVQVYPVAVVVTVLGVYVVGVVLQRLDAGAVVVAIVFADPHPPGGIITLQEVFPFVSILTIGLLLGQVPVTLLW